MTNLRSLPVLLALLVMAGCAGLQVSQDYAPGTDFSRLQTWDWFPATREPTGNVQLDSPLIDERVRSAITRELGLRGYRKVADRTPDFFVHYQLSSRRKLDSSGVRTSVGIGSYGSGGGFGVGIGGPSVREYEEGTLVIDLVDAGSRKLLWRGTGSGRLSRATTPQESTAAVDSTVGEILKQFPPGE